MTTKITVREEMIQRLEYNFTVTGVWVTSLIVSVILMLITVWACIPVVLSLLCLWKIGLVKVEPEDATRLERLRVKYMSRRRRIKDQHMIGFFIMCGVAFGVVQGLFIDNFYALILFALGLWCWRDVL